MLSSPKCFVFILNRSYTWPRLLQGGLGGWCPTSNVGPCTWHGRVLPCEAYPVLLENVCPPYNSHLIPCFLHTLTSPWHPELCFHLTSSSLLNSSSPPSTKSLPLPRGSPLKNPNPPQGPAGCPSAVYQVPGFPTTPQFCCWLDHPPSLSSANVNRVEGAVGQSIYSHGSGVLARDRWSAQLDSFSRRFHSQGKPRRERTKAPSGGWPHGG